MIDFFRKNKKNAEKIKPTANDVVVIKRSDPKSCGGTDATQNINAPKTINSDKIVFFSVTSALHPSKKVSHETENIAPGYVSAFGIPVKNGTFLFLETGRSFSCHDKRNFSWALVKDDPFTELAQIVKCHNLAKNNGFHSRTHGLPENFGGSVEILYDDGEEISFSNNQVPVISSDAGTEIAQFFTEKMNGEKALLPDTDSLSEICYCEERGDGGSLKADLHILNDGSGVIKRASRNSEGTEYTNDIPVDKARVDEIKKIISNHGMFAWQGAIDAKHHVKENSKITFGFANGEEIVVEDHRSLPEKISVAFFNIKLEIAVKH
jgi:hypothetical protein